MKPSPKPTSFQMKVYKATSCIPRGKVATYGWVARQIGCRSAQAVGGALRVNPFAPKVPCHRVIAADGSLHGFAGHTSGPLLAKKGCSGECGTTSGGMRSGWLRKVA